MFTLRFDMRAPATGAPSGELYAAALEMCAWAESRGAMAAVVSEHHGTEDGHLPSPLLLASAIAARTQVLPILLAAVVLPFWDPVRLAEDMSVLDIISNGRVAYAFGIGHRAPEYEHFGADMSRRGRLADEKLALLLQLLRGEPVIHQGRRIHITPPCVTPGGPHIMVAGGSAAAAKRAARHGLGFIAQTNSAALREAYESQCRNHGREPGPLRLPDVDAPTTVFVADDVDKAWDELGPYLLHDAVTAAAYRHGDRTVASISPAASVAELRATPGPYRVFTVAEAAAQLRSGGSLPLLPLCGGLPPALAWPYLERAVSARNEGKP
ncbi:LLM class flavin-dependent oxidoreductase [Mycolicibacter sp. MYC123]|uniref:LLM class flavin-dependent oxidoreductase n=1 Tax=[Mycobacterium] zoologicum TaxID=2872311 RepID=A0ABU5YL68_9MYCO|nr:MULTISPECIES: LLM class flavin-dependent oxidoreductase [unclassified Mycolicibacter]MEB3050808.1 LLM class flavin-dependent oxidoreductase [Mycolicibacter sp. MYC123]MEB3061343.1 LLM class flavin-dependent oxidoreductase [Mycolicibacter sp. MYC101]